MRKTHRRAWSRHAGPPPGRQDTADTLKARLRPLDFYAVELPGLPKPKRSAGWADGGLCPFHDDHRRGNFRVNLSTGAFKCFACQANGGDIIAFAMVRYGLSFTDALRYCRGVAR